MSLPESAIGLESAFSWKSYSVQPGGKEPLLRFICEALESRGCSIIHRPDPRRAPFFIVYETPGGERLGLLAYAFLANTKVTTNRPEDEHRFQIKYGSELKGVLEVGLDPHKLITTIFVGIDPTLGIFVAADPGMNNPSPMSRSVEFKTANVEEILDRGWAAWERQRNAPKTKTRPTAFLDEDTRIQVLVGGRKDRLFDLIQLESAAAGLDTGERHLLAEKLAKRRSAGDVKASHPLLEELRLPPDALFDLIEGASRLKMAVRGWVAEAKLVEWLATVDGVTECHRLEGEGQPDVSLRWRGGPPLLIECKNVLRKTDAQGNPRIDFQRTRASKGDPCSRFYRVDDFPILAASLHAVTEQWEFRFALTAELPPHKSCPNRISNGIIVKEPVFTSNPERVFSVCSGAPS
jgi:hypothetical protein